MKKYLAFFLLLAFAPMTKAQNLNLIRDSLVYFYIDSDSNYFPAEGRYDENKLKQGEFKEYVAMNDLVVVTLDGRPVQLAASYVFYFEGNYVNDTLEGTGKFYMLEDKTLRKTLQKELNFVSGQREGSFKYFFPNGKTALEGNFAADKMQGKVTGYYDDGKLFSTLNFDQGKKTGKHTYFYPSGQTEEIRSYADDVLNGACESYYPNGNKKESFTAKNGEIDGTYRYYYENGQIWIEKIYQNGLLMNITGSYDQKGKKRNFGTLKNGNGTVNYYTAEGKIYSTITYVNGKETKK